MSARGLPAPLPLGFARSSPRSVNSQYAHLSAAGLARTTVLSAPGNYHPTRAVQLRWSELAESHRPGEWQGLSLTVLGAPVPGLTVSVCARKRIRLAAQERPLLWARIDDFYSGYELLRSSGAMSPGVIPPIPFALAEQHRHAGDRPGFDRAWARAFAEMLASSNASPLSDGPWRLGSNGGARGLRDLAPNLVTKIVGQQSHGYLEWDFGDDLYPITLRQPSPPHSGRVRAWRKLVRNASLPPILLYWVSGLDAYVVLDGHDRLKNSDVLIWLPPRLVGDQYQPARVRR